MADTTPRAFSLPPDPSTPILPITPVLTPVTYQSFVPLNDGSVGAAWVEIGGSPGARPGYVYWGTSPDPTTLVTVPGSVTMTQTLISQTPFQHSGFRVSVQRGPDGFLYLSLFVLRSSTLVAGLLPLPPNKGTYVYRSTDEGVSWTLHGNVQVYGGPTGGSFGGFGDMGEIFFSDSGRWILPYGRITSFFTASRGQVAIATSDDFGVTWTNRVSMSSQVGEASTRQIVYNPVDGYLYHCHKRSQNPNFQWRVSTDDGTTWVNFHQVNYFSGDIFENQVWGGVTSNTGGMTWFSNMAAARVYDVNSALSVAADPSAEPVLLANYPAFNASQLGNGIQPVGGGWWVQMDTDEILGIPEFEATECSASAVVTCCDEVAP